VKPYYEHNGITIYHGDCREILGGLPKADLLLTDPPYGIGAARANFGGKGVVRHMSGLCSGKAIPKREYGDSGWDDAPADDVVLKQAISMTDWQIIFGGNYFDLPKTKCWLLWDKLRGETDYADGEMAWTNLDKAVRIIRWKWNGFLTENNDPRDERVHPTQKPVAVMHWAIRQAPAGVRTILDPYCGSCTTLVAAKALNRQAIGIEISEEYCEIGAKRLSQETLQFESAKDSVVATQENLL
jgi:DNA modification methylase